MTGIGAAASSAPSESRALLTRRVKVLRLYHGGVIAEYRWRDRHLRKRYGYDLHLVTPKAFLEGPGMVSSEPENHDLPVHVLDVHGPTAPNLFWYDARQLRALLIELRPDIVDLHEEPFGLAAAAALPLINRYAPDAAVCFYTAQNLPKRYPPPFSWFESRVLKRAAWAYPCSTEAGNRLRARGFEGCIKVIPLGVTVPELPREHPPDATIGFVGRLEPYKGAHIALAAFAQVAAVHPEATFVVVGSGSQSDALEAEARRLGVADKVTFTGALSQDAAQARMSSFDLLLVPSLTTPGWVEQFGRVAVEAMAAGCVVIASDSGALADVVGDVGVLVPEGDAGKLANAISTLLGDRTLLATKSAAARQASQQYTWEAVAGEMDAMYQQIIVAQHASRRVTLGSLFSRT